MAHDARATDEHKIRARNSSWVTALRGKFIQRACTTRIQATVMVATDGNGARADSGHAGGEKSRESCALETQRGRGDAKSRKADLTGGSATTSSEDYGDWLAKDYEHSKAQIAAGGCGIAGGDCPEGFEHAPFRCGAEVICGACGAIMPRGQRRLSSRDAPRFWSKLGMRCDDVNPRHIMPHYAAAGSMAGLRGLAGPRNGAGQRQRQV